MGIIQEEFYIPDEISIGVATGIYKICGGVVRNVANGQIVCHLVPIGQKVAENAQGFGKGLMELCKEHPVKAAATGTGIVLAGYGLIKLGKWSYSKIKEHETKVLKEFRESLRVYLDAVSKGKMNIATIDDLSMHLNALKADKRYSKYQIKLTAEEFGTVVNLIHNYTEKLASDNNIELPNSKAQNDMMGALRECLENQRRMFMACA